MKKYWQRFWSLDRDEKFNLITLLLTIGLALFTAVFTFTDFGWFSLSNAQSLAAILVILGVMASMQLVEKYGVLQDIKNSIKHLKDTNVLLSSRGEVEGKYSLDDRFGKADRVRIAALASVGLWTGTPFNVIKKAVEQEHTRFDFLSVDPQSATVDEVMANKITDDDLTLMSRPLEQYRRACEKSPEFAAKVTYNVFDINLPYALMIVDKKDGSKLLKIDLYDYLTDDADRRSFFVVLDDADPLYKFYDRQWDKYAAAAHPYQKGAPHA
ncbi:hypothetical protein [Lacticaseibacillus daqingensis]|uniref:hypothetical protein n=1 Tax=Lacticaseibacillus daqingensis TaxID=2486014 RepID=UPI000F76E067|nr:hypothetical protein [Lacticaseibacillus daqingensis]